MEIWEQPDEVRIAQAQARVAEMIRNRESK